MSTSSSITTATRGRRDAACLKSAPYVTASLATTPLSDPRTVAASRMHSVNPASPVRVT